MSTLPKRQPEGIPVGGQFASASHSEPGITLRSPASAATIPAPLSKERVAEAHRKLAEASGGVVGISSFPAPDQKPGQFAVSFDCNHDLLLFVETDAGGQHWGRVDYSPNGIKSRQPLDEILTAEHIMGLAGENDNYPFDVWEDNPGTHQAGVDVVAAVNELANSRPAVISATPLPRMPGSGFEGRHSGQPAQAPGRFGGDDVDLAVDTVMSGPLSRGIAAADRRQAVQTWHEWAQRRGAETGDEEYADFAAGIKTGITSLYEGHLRTDEIPVDRFDGDNIPTYVMDHALQAASRKRTTGESREHWRRLLKHTPSESWHRGHLAAGVILSGADDYWGMREDPEHAVRGNPGR